MVSISSFMYLKISRKGMKRLGGRSDQHPCLAKLPLAHTPALADVAIDDFSTGVFTETLGVAGNLPWVGFQSGSMVGGSRAVAVETFDSIGEARPTTVAVTPAGAFEVQSGPGISHRINLIYGKTPNGDAPLALDLSNEDRIRIHFTHNNSPFNQINFNLTMYNGVSPYLQIGYNVPGSAVPFDWDFMFADAIQGGSSWRDKIRLFRH